MAFLFLSFLYYLIGRDMKDVSLISSLKYRGTVMQELSKDERIFISHEDSMMARLMWCESCQDFTEHEVWFKGTITRADEFIIEIGRICHASVYKFSTYSLVEHNQGWCEEESTDYLNVFDYNALVFNEYL